MSHLNQQLRTLVTGVASGIGRSVVESLRNRGDAVFGVDYQAGDDWLQADLSVPSERERVVKLALEELGAIDVLVNVAGIGALENSDNPTGSQCLASYLVSDTAQKFFVEKSFEYPLVDGIAPFDGLPTLAELDPPSIDLSDLQSIAETQELLNDIGLLSL